MVHPRRPLRGGRPGGMRAGTGVVHALRTPARPSVGPGRGALAGGGGADVGLAAVGRRGCGPGAARQLPGQRRRPCVGRFGPACGLRGGSALPVALAAAQSFPRPAAVPGRRAVGLLPACRRQRFHPAGQPDGGGRRGRQMARQGGRRPLRSRLGRRLHPSAGPAAAAGDELSTLRLRHAGHRAPDGADGKVAALPAPLPARVPGHDAGRAAGLPALPAGWLRLGLPLCAPDQPAGGALGGLGRSPRPAHATPGRLLARAHAPAGHAQLLGRADDEPGGGRLCLPAAGRAAPAQATPGPWPALVPAVAGAVGAARKGPSGRRPGRRRAMRPGVGPVAGRAVSLGAGDHLPVRRLRGQRHPAPGRRHGGGGRRPHRQPDPRCPADGGSRGGCPDPHPRGCGPQRRGGEPAAQPAGAGAVLP